MQIYESESYYLKTMNFRLLLAYLLMLLMLENNRACNWCFHNVQALRSSNEYLHDCKLFKSNTLERKLV
jgi:hypothetical protein